MWGKGAAATMRGQSKLVIADEGMERSGRKGSVWRTANSGFLTS